MEKTKKGNPFAAVYSIAITAIFSLILVFPASRAVFAAFSGAHPFFSALIKFTLLATVGELFALRLSTGKWAFPPYIVARALIWGVLGLFITMAFKIFGVGVQSALETGILPGGTGRFWKAFMTSFWCNLFFAPFMMGVHKLTDTYLELKEKGQSNIRLTDLAEAINWKVYVSFTLFRTIPLFWIPAHTITFMLPGEYQTIMAAYLSIALGIILNLKRRE